MVEARSQRPPTTVAALSAGIDGSRRTVTELSHTAESDDVDVVPGQSADVPGGAVPEPAVVEEEPCGATDP
jgi:hypothetical protein